MGDTVSDYVIVKIIFNKILFKTLLKMIKKHLFIEMYAMSFTWVCQSLLKATTKNQAELVVMDKHHYVTSFLTIKTDKNGSV